MNTKRTKWLIAFYVFFGEEKIVKIWTGKVSYNVTDVTVPLNTLFYFFSEEAEINLAVTSIKLSEIRVAACFNETPLCIQNNTLYCCGKRRGKDLVLIEDGKESIIRDFFNLSNDFRIEFV